MATDELQNLQDNIQRLKKQLAGKRNTLVTIGPEEQVRIKQQIEDLRRLIRDFEREKWDLVASESQEASFDCRGEKSAKKVSIPSIPSNVGKSTVNFVGREDELTLIHQQLQTEQGVIVCAVEGLGGIGKTALALEYAKRYQQEYAAQYWLSLRLSGLAEEIVKLAGPYLSLPEILKKESLEKQVDWYWQNWLPQQGKLLLILDDVPNIDRIPDRMLPKDSRIKILVTTRERCLNTEFESIALDVLPLDKCVELLTKIVGTAKVEQEKALVEQICHEILGRLTLAVELVGEYLAKNRHLKFSHLRNKLNLAHAALTKERNHKDYGHLGVAAAIKISWDDLSSAVQKVAMLLSLFAPVAIAWTLLEDTAKSTEITESELEEARRQLDNSHLMQPVDEDYSFYQIHPLVREFFQQQLQAIPQINSLYRCAFVETLLTIAKTIPQTPTREIITAVNPAIPHLQLVSQTMLDDIPNPEDNLILVFLGVALFYKGQGEYDLAAVTLTKCCEEIQSRLGENHPHVAASLNNLAGLYRCQGRYTEAESLYKHSLFLREQLLGENHLDVAQSLNNLAVLYEYQGRYAEAEYLCKRCLSLIEQLLGENNLYFATILNNLAGLYESQGRYAEAEPLYKRSLSLKEQLLVENHPDVATILKNLAKLYESQGRYAEAEPLYKRSLSLKEQLLEENHPSVATSLNNLAELYESQGRYAEAEPLYVRAIAIYQERLGENHPDTQKVRQNFRILSNKAAAFL
ncbi:Kinesin light chain (modular protein) [Microcystis aeruginosa PCC 9807]|uniref:Kinesin light chain (Modular protein) n=1 Tax=Microcystis aeruginosa PCC 9807 TaxID=1160283 RepID=I4H4D3_MICAE|nr:tetratricopeptide repeat protein [Microcystis aeruginosa]CCI16907.1 Kinesin light chain (modular protein) [Microcystis aeruginosa PCC 9807]